MCRRADVGPGIWRGQFSTTIIDILENCSQLEQFHPPPAGTRPLGGLCSAESALKNSLRLDTGAGKYLKTINDPMYRSRPGHSIERGTSCIRRHGNKHVA